LIKNNVIIVEIKGGFGNQLFQFVYANELKNLGYKVYVNTRFYNYKSKETQNNTPRNLIIDEKYFGFKNINYFLYRFILLNKKLNESRYFNNFFTNEKNKIYKKFKDSNFKEELLNAKFIHLDGYWQNSKNLLTNRDYLLDSLKKIPEINSAITTKAKKGSVLVLVRRGDYLEMGEDLNLEFYKNCIDFLQKNNNDLSFNIFTDDVNWVKSKNIFNIADKIYGPEIDSEKVILLFCKMINHQNYIIGNSTFSFFAAFLGKEKNSQVLIADPWFRNKKYPDLYIKDWIRIENH
jgi:hypothetical protein